MSDKGNDPAFPVMEYVGDTEANKWFLPKGGLTKREWMAGMAMRDTWTNTGYPFTASECARRAYEMADAMLKEGEK